MKKWKCMCREFCSIHLVDKCLIIFMAALLFQSAYTLLTGEASAAPSNEIDVIVRTAASIFGYFLSANFIRAIWKNRNYGKLRWSRSRNRRMKLRTV